MGRYAAVCSTKEHVAEEALHLRRLTFKALKYFSIAIECHEELLRDFGVSMPTEQDAMLKTYHRRLMKRFHPDVRLWFGFGADAPSLEEVNQAYVSRNLHWLVWADVEYGIATLEAHEQVILLENAIGDFATAIRNTRVAYRQLQQGDAVTLNWKTVTELRAVA